MIVGWAALAAGRGWTAADDTVRLATLISATGMVRIKETPAAAIATAAVGQALPEGAQVITLKDARCQIRFDDGHFVTLAEATTITLDRLPRRKGTVQTLLHLLRGKIRAMVDRSRGEGDFGCYGSTTVTAVKGTDYEMTRDDADQTEVDVNEGKVNVAESKSEDPEEVSKVFSAALAGMIGVVLAENEMIRNGPGSHMTKPMQRPRPPKKPEALNEHPKGGSHEPGGKGKGAKGPGGRGGGMPGMGGLGGFGGLP